VITSFSKFEFQMELKFGRPDDAFQEWHPGVNHTLERDSVSGKDTKGQITSYAAAHLAKQFRTFVYSVLICGHGKNCEARLLRWDRAGAVVTEPFPVQRRGLANFFWRYNHLSPEARGVDMSVSRPSEEQADVALKALKLPSSARSTLTTISAVNTDGDNAVGTFIVGDPAFQSTLSATGRSNRGFVAYHLEKKKVVFLKDTWRIDMEGMTREGKIYTTLHSHHIPHIAPCVLSGDVAQDQTRSQSILPRPWACTVERKQLVPMVHYRLVLGIVGGVLNDFTSTRELVVAVGDAFEGL
jgi:Fungal protein kinase